jgi:hypothetical protein
MRREQPREGIAEIARDRGHHAPSGKEPEPDDFRIS